SKCEAIDLLNHRSDMTLCSLDRLIQRGPVFELLFEQPKVVVDEDRVRVADVLSGAVRLRHVSLLHPVNLGHVDLRVELGRSRMSNGIRGARGVTSYCPSLCTGGASTLRPLPLGALRKTTGPIENDEFGSGRRGSVEALAHPRQQGL